MRAGATAVTHVLGAFRYLGIRTGHVAGAPNRDDPLTARQRRGKITPAKPTIKTPPHEPDTSGEYMRTPAAARHVKLGEEYWEAVRYPR
jgi:hypothetical protein